VIEPFSILIVKCCENIIRLFKTLLFPRQNNSAHNPEVPFPKQNIVVLFLRIAFPVSKYYSVMGMELPGRDYYCSVLGMTYPGCESMVSIISTEDVTHTISR
jgi:hypothetical protein